MRAWCPSGWASSSPSLTSLPRSPWANLPLMVVPSQEVSWAHQGRRQVSVASLHSWRTAGCSVLTTHTHTHTWAVSTPSRNTEGGNSVT